MEQTASTDQAVAEMPTPTDLVNEKLNEDAAELVTRYVVVQVNENQYGMLTASTIELMSAEMTQITRVPHSPSYISGVINHRGTIIPVIDLRSLLGFKPRSSEAERLEDMFSKLKDDHSKWLNSLQESVHLDARFTGETDPALCEFGIWYGAIMDGSSPMCAIVNADPILKSYIERFEIPHKRIHALADKVFALKSEGNTEKAIEKINDARENELETMNDLFDRVLETFAAKLESMMVITEFDSRKAAIAVDGVSFVIDCKNDSIEPLPDTAENAEFLTGLVHQPDGTYILIADLNHIYNTACPTE